MAISSFSSGPFSFGPVKSLTLAGSQVIVWQVQYGNRDLAERHAPAGATQAQVRELFSDDIAAFVSEMKAEHAPDLVQVIDFESDTVLTSFPVAGSIGLTPGIIDDRSALWLRSPNRLYSKAISLAGLIEFSVQHKAPHNAWMLGLLPDDVVTSDPSEWCAPSSWEIRHLVGEGSLTGVSGAHAAQLVGVTPQNFRKYTAADGASTRQSISFAMWHLLLQRLDIQAIRP